MQSAGSGGNGLSRLGGGLTRYCSAPATWLDALLEADDETEALLDSSPIFSSPVKQSLLPATAGVSSQPLQPAVQVGSSASSRFGLDLDLLDSVGSGGGGLTGLLRQNSSPAEFLSDGYFSGFGVSGNYEYVMSMDDSQPASKRPREADSDKVRARASSPAVKAEQSGHLHGVLLDGEMDKLTEDSVLCKVRAKRGCATHPRSIAERVRRTRISDRIRKLQELVPNMDKQTNTADMLEEAVEYVIFLQKQIQELTEQQKKCSCSTKD